MPKEMKEILGNATGRDSEKGIVLEVALYCGFGRDVEKKEAWFPKSQVEVHDDGTLLVSEWILGEKNKELSEEMGRDVAIIESSEVE